MHSNCGIDILLSLERRWGFNLCEWLCAVRDKSPLGLELVHSSSSNPHLRSKLGGSIEGRSWDAYSGDFWCRRNYIIERNP